MSRVARAAAPAAEPSYPVWKAKAVKAVQRLHERPAVVIRESIWTRAYILRLEPAEDAKLGRARVRQHAPAELGASEPTGGQLFVASQIRR